MRRLFVLGALAAPLLLSAAHHESTDEKGIREAIDHYFQGHATGDGNHFRAVFHPASSLFAVRDGKFWELSSADYAARASGTPPADEARRKRWIESIDVTGNAAIVKVKLDYPTTVFTDYMSMLRIDGSWKIVAKTFESEPRG